MEMEDIYKKVAAQLGDSMEKPVPSELSRGLDTLTKYGEQEAIDHKQKVLEEQLKQERSLHADNSYLQAVLLAEFGDQLNEDETAIMSAIRLLKASKELPLSTDWMETLSGLAFEPLGEDPQYRLRDLIWGCARLCRFAGQISEEHEHYSVAEHLVLTTRWLMSTSDPDVVALMPDTPGDSKQILKTMVAHDLQEGLVGDMVRPMKRQDAFYRKAEDRLSAHLAARYDLIFPLPEVVKLVDNRVLLDERAQALNPSGLHWGSIEGLKPLGVELQFWSPRQAAYELTKLMAELGFPVEDF